MRTDGQTYIHTGMTKLMAVFCNFAKPHKNLRRLNFFLSEYGLKAVSCKHSNDHLVSIKGWRSLSTLATISLSRKTLYNRVSYAFIFFPS
jgi:hypothetical protein